MDFSTSLFERGRAGALLLALLCFLPLFASPSMAADKIRYGLLAGPQTVYVGIEEGYFKKHGIEVEPIVFRSGAEIVPALSTGQIDIAATAAGAALYNAIGRGVNAKIVGDYIVFEKMPALSGVAVRSALYESGKIRKPADLKGAKVAVTARGQAMHLLAVKMLEQAGLSETDISTVFMPMPDMLVALKSGAIDAMVTSDPFVTMSEDEKIGVEIVNMWTVVPDFTLGVVMYGQRVLGDRDLGLRFIKAFSEANRFLRTNDNPEGRAAITRVYQKYFPMKDPALYSRVRLGMGRAAMETNVHGKNGLADQLKWYADRGLVLQRPDLDQAVDNSFARETAGAPAR